MGTTGQCLCKGADSGTANKKENGPYSSIMPKKNFADNPTGLRSAFCNNVPAHRPPARMWGSRCGEEAMLADPQALATLITIISSPILFRL